MRAAGAPLGRNDRGGTDAHERVIRRRRAAAAGAAATLTLAMGCAMGPPAGSLQYRTALHQIHGATEAGLDLYASGEYVLAAHRFGDAAVRAGTIGQRDMQRRAAIGECMSWLHAQRIGEFSACTERLERIQRRERRPDPGVNTLIALGSIAGNRPPPPLRLPTDIHALVRAAAKETVR